MDLRIVLKDSNEAQKFLYILNVGMLDSLLKGAITFDEAYAYLYRPYVAQFLRRNNANKEIIELFEECCMLEDIKNIAPEKLQSALELKRKETMDLLQSLPITNNPKYWLNEFDE